jgi:hypothetical protein
LQDSNITSDNSIVEEENPETLNTNSRSDEIVVVNVPETATVPIAPSTGSNRTQLQQRLFQPLTLVRNDNEGPNTGR